MRSVVVAALLLVACSSSAEGPMCPSSPAGTFTIAMESSGAPGCPDATGVVLAIGSDGTTSVSGAPIVATGEAPFSWSGCTATSGAGECPQLVTVVCGGGGGRAGVDAGAGEVEATFQMYLDSNGVLESDSESNGGQASNAILAPEGEGYGPAGTCEWTLTGQASE